MLARRSSLVLSLVLTAALATAAVASDKDKAFEPVSGQAGKDVVWVPTPPETVQKMLDMARVTADDFVLDLGSGDGRNIIAAAKRGARGLGVEYNEQMVELSERIAEKEGVADRAKFVQGDMYQADLSGATVLALFLLTENLDVLSPKFEQLPVGTRIVVNAFQISNWDPEATERAQGDCGAWCTVHLYLVPARVAGTWDLGEGELTLEQNVQRVRGVLKSGRDERPISEGRISGDRISFEVAGLRYNGRVNGTQIEGQMEGARNGKWVAKKK